MTTKTLYIQKAEVKRWFSTGLMDDTDKQKSHTWCPTVKKRIRAHEEKVTWQTRSRKSHAEEFLARPNAARPQLGVALRAIWDWAVRAWMLSLTAGQSPVKSNLKKWGPTPLYSATAAMGTKHFSTSNFTATLLIVET